ncbi:ABC transporter ATP-binding protein [uncultured Anaerococcus sp.]|uniref:ATP-binding cassette domain-containing protein n=1 Tax=uncultured Anaerococcus sp. TaxID=293428 RepID=UPI00261E029B|nr:ABC transporter ATP-binding protein [uncultured Anaerococcus sp.]
MINKVIRKSSIYIILQILFSILSTITIAAIPILHKILIDDVIPQSSLIHLKKIFIYYLIAILSYLLFTFLSEKFVWRTAIDFENRMQKIIFSRLTELNYDRYSSKKTEEYYALLTKNITQIEQDYLTPEISLFKSLFSILIYGTITFIYNKLIFFIILILSLTVVFIPKVFKGKLKSLASIYIKQNEKYANIVNELLRAFDMIDSKVKKSFNSKFSYETTLLSGKRLDYGSVKIVSNLVSGGLIMILEMIILIISVYFSIINIITVGEVVMFFSYSKSFTDPLTEILYCINAINSTEDIRNDLNEFLNQEPTDISFNELFTDDRLIIDNVEVTYPDKKYIYNCEFRKGGKYIIFGDSGSGKSTLLKLLAGKVSDNAKVSPSFNYSNDEISYLSQEQIIFSDDFYNNVTLYGAYNYNDNLTNFYDDKYINKEDVSVMSGGEKQYIKIIRSLIQNKKLLLLDEPTTGMDEMSAKRIMESISNLEDTVVVVTHNISIVNQDKWSLLNIDEVREII